MSSRPYEVLEADDDVDIFLVAHRRASTQRYLFAVCAALAVSASIGCLVLKLRYDRALLSRSGELGALESRIGALREEQNARRRDLDALHGSIDAARLDLRASEKQARSAECRASNAKLDAEVTIERVRCYQALAEHYACAAENSKEKADSAMLGAVIGAGLSIIIGGGALLAVGGAAIGHSSAGNDACPDVQCDLEIAAIEPVVLAKHGLTQRARCEQTNE